MSRTSHTVGRGRRGRSSCGSARNRRRSSSPRSMIWALVRSAINGVANVELLLAFHARLGGQVGHGFEGSDVLEPDRSGDDQSGRRALTPMKTSLAPRSLSPRQGEGQEDSVARGRYVGYWDTLAEIIPPGRDGAPRCRRSAPNLRRPVGRCRPRRGPPRPSRLRPDGLRPVRLRGVGRSRSSGRTAADSLHLGQSPSTVVESKPPLSSTTAR